MRQRAAIVAAALKAPSGRADSAGMESLTEAPSTFGPAAEPTTRGVRILVAEDNPVNATVAVKMLEKRGHHAELARDGRLALEMLESGSYEAVLMDCQMPEMDGYEAAAEIRRREGDGPRIPIIAMTAHAMAGDREKCLAAGMDDYMSKPIRSDALQEMLLAWVKAPAEDARDMPADVPEQPATAAQAPLLDEEIVDDLQAAGAETVATIVELFAGQSVSQVAAIRELVSAGNAPGAAEKAHLLKGGGASVGAVRVAALAGEIETLARADRLVETTALVEALASSIDPSLSALRAATGSPQGRVASDGPAA